MVSVINHPVPYNGTYFTLSGIVQLDSSVNTNVTVVSVWSGNDSPQVTSFPPYQNDLTFQPLGPYNSTDYILNVTVAPTDNSPFIAQSKGSIEYTLTVQRKLIDFVTLLVHTWFT